MVVLFEYQVLGSGVKTLGPAFTGRTWQWRFCPLVEGTAGSLLRLSLLGENPHGWIHRQWHPCSVSLLKTLLLGNLLVAQVLSEAVVVVDVLL